MKDADEAVILGLGNLLRVAENPPIPANVAYPRGGGRALAGQFFFECDLEGRITWMSEKARERLGPTANLLQAIPKETLEDARRFLGGRETSDTLAAVFFRERRGPVPVRLSRLLTSGTRVVVSAEVRERASDAESGNGRELVALESRVLEKHFRLLRAQQALDSQCRRSRKDLGALLMAQLERERARLGRELHAGAGQALSGIKIHLELVQRLLAEPPAAVQESLRKIDALTQQALMEIRSVSRSLHPPDWQGMKLRAALQNLWEASGIPQKFRASLRLGELSAEPSLAVRALIYRAAQEAISNALRHSGATAIGLSLEESAGRIVLRVEDNGKGFQNEQARVSPGIGLRAMAEQARSLEGALEITSGPDGTTLKVSAPLETTDEQA